MKRTTIKVLAFVFALLMLLPSVAACGDKEVKITPIAEGACTIVYDGTVCTSATAKELAKAIKEKTGAEAEVGRVYKSSSAAQIVVGPVKDCPNADAVLFDLREGEYALRVSGNDYVVAAYDQKTLTDAIDYFTETVLAGFKKGKLTVGSGADYLCEVTTYRLTGVTLGGKSIGHASIVIPEDPSVSEYRTAVLLREQIKKLTGYVLPIDEGVENASRETQIRIGTPICETAKAETPHAYEIVGADGVLEVAAESFFGYEEAQRVLSNKIFAARNTEMKSLDTSVSLSGDGKGNIREATENEGTVRVMFNNIHGYDTAEFPGKPVADMLSEVYAEYMPDVLGLQECHVGVRGAGFDENMRALGYVELAVDFSSNGSSTNPTPLFYRPDTVEPLSKGYVCYNTLTYNEYPGTLEGYSSAQVKRTSKDFSKGFTWGIFRMKATGELFLVASTHLWWKNECMEDDIARSVQLTYAKDLMIEKAKTYLFDAGLDAGTMPMFLGGDYNTTWSLTNFRTRLQSVMTNATGTSGASFFNVNRAAPSEKSVTMSSHHGYARFDDDLGIYVDQQVSTGEYGKGLDHIFCDEAARGMFTIKRVSLITAPYCYFSTDHLPIFVDFSFTDTVPKKQ